MKNALRWLFGGEFVNNKPTTPTTPAEVVQASTVVPRKAVYRDEDGAYQLEKGTDVEVEVLQRQAQLKELGWTGHITIAPNSNTGGYWVRIAKTVRSVSGDEMIAFLKG